MDGDWISMRVELVAGLGEDYDVPGAGRLPDRHRDNPSAPGRAVGPRDTAGLPPAWDPKHQVTAPVAP